MSTWNEIRKNVFDRYDFKAAENAEERKSMFKQAVSQASKEWDTYKTKNSKSNDEPISKPRGRPRSQKAKAIKDKKSTKPIVKDKKPKTVSKKTATRKAPAATRKVTQQRERKTSIEDVWDYNKLDEKNRKTAEELLKYLRRKQKTQSLTTKEKEFVRDTQQQRKNPPRKTVLPAREEYSDEDEEEYTTHRKKDWAKQLRDERVVNLSEEDEDENDDYESYRSYEGTDDEYESYQSSSE